MIGTENKLVVARSEGSREKEIVREVKRYKFSATKYMKSQV